MVWGFKTTLNNQQGLSRTQVTLVQVLCLHHNSKIFQELTQLRLRGHLVSEATPAALCSRCFWRMKWKIFPPWRGWGSSAAPRSSCSSHWEPQGTRGTQRGPEQLQRQKQARGNKAVTSSLPTKGYSRGITPSMEPDKLSSWATSASSSLQNQTFDLPHNPQQTWDFSLVWSHFGAYAALKQNTAW